MPAQIFRDFQKIYPVISRGKGVYLYDQAGRQYLDAVGGIAVVNVGHAVPEIIAAMTEQARVNIPEWSVSELSAALKRTVEDAYGFVRVRGEISGYRGPHSSGHCYFSLKDEGARIDAVIWRGVFGRIRFKPEEGLDLGEGAGADDVGNHVRPHLGELHVHLALQPWRQIGGDEADEHGDHHA